jgi:hypothetical protein
LSYQEGSYYNKEVILAKKGEKFHWTEEHRANHAAAMRSSEVSEKISEGNKRKDVKQSPKNKAALLEANKRKRGTKMTAETRLKMSKAHKGRPYVMTPARLEELKRRKPLTDATKAKLSAARKGKPGPVFSEEVRRRFSENASRPENRAACLASTHRRHEYVDAQCRKWQMRSSWEVGYAKMLDAQSLSWTYEPHRLRLSNGRIYIPDFWVEEWQCYVEIKGYDFGGDLRKVYIAQQDGYNIKLIHGKKAYNEAIGVN